MFKRIDHVELVVANLQDSIDFYVEVLGFTLKQRMRVDSAPLEEIAYLGLGDTVLELMKVAGATSSSTGPWSLGYRMMALEVEDMERVVEYLKGKGVKITWGPVTLGLSKRAEIKDIDGNPVELRQW